MTVSMVIGVALRGAALAARVTVSTMAVLLIARSLAATYLPFSAGRFMWFLNGLTGSIAEPVRNLLPGRLGGRRPDYASLATAICLLLLGFGVNEIFVMMESGL